MTSLSFIECCHLLDIDPKTLRQWLTQAQMSLHAHPTDARIKCLTGEQVYVLASLHDRVLQADQPALASANPRSDETHHQMPLAAVSDADLRARLALLETQVTALQAQRDFPGAPTPQGARAAHRAASARSGSPVFLMRRTVACFANWLCFISARPASNTSVCVPSYGKTSAAHPAH